MIENELHKIWREHDLMILESEQALVHLVYRKSGGPLRICRPSMLKSTKEGETAVWQAPIGNCGSVGEFARVVEEMGKRPCKHCLSFSA
jgi:hypothetical protein